MCRVLFCALILEIFRFFRFFFCFSSGEFAFVRKDFDEEKFNILDQICSCNQSFLHFLPTIAVGSSKKSPKLALFLFCVQIIYFVDKVIIALSLYVGITGISAGMTRRVWA